jgi:hypothetical protein
MRAVCGEHGAGEVIPSKPEEVWGDKRNPASDYPKCIMKRLLRRDATADDFAAVAARSRVDRVRSTCPQSFAPFADESAAAARKLGIDSDGGPRSSRPPRRRR